MQIVYSPRYNITCFGLEKLHPFDSAKYGRAWRHIQQQEGARLRDCHIRVAHPVRHEDLLRVHTPEYLASLLSSAKIARALELPFLRHVPYVIIADRILKPMRLAAQGTLLAAQAALIDGHDLAINLSGGYHHASRKRGEGFCLYADVCIAIQCLTDSGHLGADDRILYIDLDAHQGNGVERIARGDPRVVIFDMYNRDIYPRDHAAKTRIDWDLPLPSGTGDDTYLSRLAAELPKMLMEGPFRMAFYNAGTDVFEGDRLGGLCLSESAIQERDGFVLDSLAQRGIPCVMVASGGYSADSYRLIANTVVERLRRHGSARGTGE